MKYKFLDHTADVKFQAFGKTLEEAFVNSAKALTETITKNNKIKGIKERKLSIKGKDKIALLKNFLEEFLFLIDTEDFVLSEIKKLIINENELTAIIIGDKASKYKFVNDVKAITYNEMEITQNKGKWVCQVVVDV